MLAPYSMVSDWLVLRIGQCFFIGLSCSIPTIVFYYFFFSLLSVYRFILWGWGLRTDRVYITLSQPCILPTSFNNKYPMPLLRTTQLVQLLLHIDTSSHLSQSSIVQHTFQRSPRSIPLIHSVYHIPYTTSIRCHSRLQVLEIMHFLLRLAI